MFDSKDNPSTSRSWPLGVVLRCLAVVLGIGVLLIPSIANAEAPEWGYTPRTVTIDGTPVTLVEIGANCAIETVISRYGSVFEQQTRQKLTWETLYAYDSNREHMIPVCLKPKPGGSIRIGRGILGQDVWDPMNCPDDQRYAWFIAGEKIKIPMKPVETWDQMNARLREQDVCFKNVDCLTARVAKLGGKVPEVAATTPKAAPPPPPEPAASETAPPAPPPLPSDQRSPEQPWVFATILLTLLGIAGIVYVSFFKKAHADKVAGLKRANETLLAKRDEAVRQLESLRGQLGAQTEKPELREERRHVEEMITDISERERLVGQKELRVRTMIKDLLELVGLPADTDFDLVPDDGISVIIGQIVADTKSAEGREQLAVDLLGTERAEHAKAQRLNEELTGKNAELTSRVSELEDMSMCASTPPPPAADLFQMVGREEAQDASHGGSHHEEDGIPPGQKRIDALRSAVIGLATDDVVTIGSAGELARWIHFLNHQEFFADPISVCCNDGQAPDGLREIMERPNVSSRLADMRLGDLPWWGGTFGDYVDESASDQKTLAPPWGAPPNANS